MSEPHDPYEQTPNNVEAAIPSETFPSAVRNPDLAARLLDILVPESAFADDLADEGEIQPADHALPTNLDKLKALLEEAGREVEVRPSRLTFGMPAGRSERAVTVDDQGAAILVADHDLLGWRSLVRYNGIWNSGLATIEVAVSSPGTGVPVRLLIGRLTSRLGGGTDTIEVQQANEGASLILGESNSLARVILGNWSPRRPTRDLTRGPTTLRLVGIDATTVESAERHIESIADTFFFELEVNHGVSLLLNRLERLTGQNRLRGHTKPGGHTRPAFKFPESTYPHAPMLLYRLGGDRRLPAVIRYWAYYQVLEYFFPTHANEAAVRRLSKYLRSPWFDPHSNENIVHAISLAASSSRPGERDQLSLTIAAISSADDIQSVVTDLGLDSWLRKDGKKLSTNIVEVSSGDVVGQLASRIYDVRCKIVHSKSDHASGEPGPGLIPGTPDDDLVRHELPILEYLAQEALVVSSEPIR